MFRFCLAMLMRPVLCRIPCGSQVIYRRILGSSFCSHLADDILKKQLVDPIRVIYDRKIRAYVAVDLTDWACRAHYFTGRYYDQLVPLLIRYFLAKGGTFIDVGANRGLHCLYAARVLAAVAGRVYAFEPNPEAFKILEAHIAINQVQNCMAYRVGLSDVEDTRPLNIPPHSGMSSFCDVVPCGAKVNVDVKTLDNMLEGLQLDGTVLVKIDVEGFEYNVLKGMAQLLGKSKVVIVCEITDKWLRKTGSSSQLLFDYMRDNGYRVSVCSTVNSLSLNKRLQLREIDSPLGEVEQYDVLFRKNDSGTENLSP